MARMSEKQPVNLNRRSVWSEAFRGFIGADWAPYDETPLPRLPAAEVAPARRAAVSRLFPGERLVVPAGGFKVRSNDTDYRYRPHSAFAHLTGLGTDREPDAVLVLEPVREGDERPDEGADGGHRATLYFMPRAPRDTEQFYADSRYGEMWVGQRDTLAQMSEQTGLVCAPIGELAEALAKDADTVALRIVREADPDLDAQVDAVRLGVTGGQTTGAESVQERRSAELAADAELSTALSELRLVKDDFEAEQLRLACAATARGFEAVVADLPEALRRGRGERWVEGVFGLHARHAGNAIGYDTIAAGGDHACTLHWIRNDGELREGDLLLLDAGVELDTLYTADITRTLPVSGRFSPAQRRVYEVVLEAQQAGIAAARPGASFGDVHRAAITVIATRLAEWGILPVSAEESLSADGGQHRRWMVHNTSHHLGLDVHDCAQARVENYRDGVLAEGMVITVEPGLYFKSTDLMVPAELRGIGVRIEDDILITADGAENLSAMLPRDPDEVETWMAGLLGR